MPTFWARVYIQLDLFYYMDMNRFYIHLSRIYFAYILERWVKKKKKKKKKNYLCIQRAACCQSLKDAR